MYVLSIIQNSILYIGFMYRYVSRIIFRMVLSTWLHTTLLYEGLDNVFVLSNLQTPSFKFSQVVFAPLQNFALMSSQKQTSVIATLQSYIAHIWPWIDLKFWWNMNYVYYLLSKFQLIYLHKVKDLATSLKSPQTRTWTQNDLQLALSNSKILEILGDT